MSIRFFHIAIFFLLFSFSGNAKTPAVDEATYERLANELDFSKTKKVWMPKDRGGKVELNPKRKEATKTNFANGFEGIFSVIGYILIALVILGVIYMGVKDFKTEKLKQSESVDLDAIEDLESVDLTKLLEEAIANQDYRLAIRLEFLIILKKLSQTEKIKWKPYKTNRVYSRELKGTPLQDDFRRIADTFEYVWYGISEVDADTYHYHRANFDEFLKRITNG